MKLAGVARFDCIGSTQEFTCYMAGLASPRRSHLRLDDQHAAQSPCLAILVPLGMWRLIDNKRHRGSAGWPHPLPAFYRPRSRSAAPDPSRYTRSVAVHPIRRGAPDQKGCNAYGSGAPPPTTSTNASIPFRHTQPTASDAATRPRHAHPGSEREALHQLGSVTPPRAGVTPLSNMPNRGQFLPTDPYRLHRTPPHGLDMLTPAPNERRCTS